MKPDPAIVTALARWVEASRNRAGEGVLLDLRIQRPCPQCDGTCFCPAGCPMAVCELDYTKTPSRRMVPGASGCEACNVLGYCLSCWPTGEERRRALKKGGDFLVDSVPMYSVPGYALTDPIKVTAAQVGRVLAAPQLELVTASTETEGVA